MEGVVPGIGERSPIESLRQEQTAKAAGRKLALEEKQRARVKHMKAEKLDGELQPFRVDAQQPRYAPNG
jgi:hypothetical protein